MDYSKLLETAIEAQQFAYAPYSNFRVGAALLTKGGKVYTGCNVENQSFGATVCAERIAIFKAVSEGERDFTAMAVTGSTGKYTPPCGICRQVISEFAPDISLVLHDQQEGMKVVKAGTLFPHRTN